MQVRVSNPICQAVLLVEAFGLYKPRNCTFYRLTANFPIDTASQPESTACRLDLLGYERYGTDVAAITCVSLSSEPSGLERP